MKFRHLQHYIMLIMFGSALMLSLLFSVVAYRLNEQQALADSQELINSLMETVHVTAATAVYSGNEIVGQDAINGLLSNQVVYAASLTQYPVPGKATLSLSGVVDRDDSGLQPVTRVLTSPFNDELVLGELTVTPSAKWINNRATETAIDIILGLTLVIFTSCLLAAQLIKYLVSKPLVDIKDKISKIAPGSNQRLEIPGHLETNEIGALVNGFNEMLKRTNQAILVERSLREKMEEVQTKLTQAKSEAEHAASAKSSFLATMSHEIRTPMNSILGFIELALEDHELGDKQRQQLSVAHNSAQFLLQLISDILDVSKIESGKLEIESRPFNLSQVLTDIYQLMKVKANEKDLDLSLELPGNLAPAYVGDEFRLQQILLNLVGNAIKFTHSGYVKIQVTCPQTHSRLQFSVEDSGIGIPKQQIDRILQPFAQIDSSMSRRFGGTGLGTTIASELLQLMGSKLEIESSEGKGSRFYFTVDLPATETLPPEQPAETFPDNLPNMPNLSKSLYILVVDDVVENINLVKIRLEKEGHTVATATTGHEAIEMTNNARFDIILMDIHMPDMDGLEATTLIRDGSNSNTNTPIIAMTASVMQEDQTKYKAVDMDAMIAKPIDFQQLLETIGRLSRRQTKPHSSLIIAGPEPRETTDLIALEEAIENWLDETEYHKALSSFLNMGEDYAINVRNLLSANKPDEAQPLVHKMKGVSGNLRLEKLYQCAVSLDQLLADTSSHESNRGDHADAFVAAYAETRTAIKDLNIPNSEMITSDQAPTNLPGEALNQFVAACNDHDPTAADTAYQSLQNRIPTKDYDAIGKKLRNFDFEGAIALLMRTEN